LTYTNSLGARRRLQYRHSAKSTKHELTDSFYSWRAAGLSPRCPVFLW
jgi:hypothetical protein